MSDNAPTPFPPDVCRFGEAPFPVVKLLGHPVHALTEVAAIDYILDRLAQRRGGWVATHNLDHLRRLDLDPDFEQLCATAALRTADGKPLVWAAELRGTPLPERVAGSDMTFSLTAAAATAGRSIFLLGGSPPATPGGKSTAELAADALTARHPALRVVGTHCPPFGFETDPHSMHALHTVLLSAGPDIVYVAIGSPKQERLIMQLLPLLPRAWFLGVGISLSFVTGEVQRAPVWMRRTGLEWAHRLGQEPRRLARRYLVEGIPFAGKLLLRSLLERVSTGPPVTPRG